MELNELEIYKASMIIAEEIWNIVVKWDYFSRETIGKQLVRAVDSVAANLGEGYGRFYYKENKQFCYYSRGSLFETKTWLKKALMRKLINEEEFERFSITIKDIGVRLNNYINSIGKKY